MRSTSSPRRAAALLAVTTIAMSTAVLSVTGIASAAPGDDGELYTFTTAAEADSLNTFDVYDVDGLTVPAGYCSVNWNVSGGSGGVSGNFGSGDKGAGISITTDVEAGQEYTFALGGEGGPAAPGTPEVFADPDNGIDAADAVDGEGGTAGLPGGTAGTGNQANGWGGGGGGYSTVGLGGEVLVKARGGDGGTDDESNPVGGTGGGANVAPEGFQTFIPINDSGQVDGYVFPCEDPVVIDAPDSDHGDESLVTGAPEAKWVYAVEGGLMFQLWTTSVSEDALVTGVQYSLDGGTWTSIDTENQGDFQYEGTITGLETGRTYSVRFRFTTADGGHTEPSAALTGAPVLPAPTGVSAVTGPSSITVDWQALAADGVTGYTAWALPEVQQEMGNEPPSCSTDSPTDLSCVIGVPAGAKYNVVVMAVDTQLGAQSEPVLTGVVPGVAVSATPPTSNGTLTSDDADGRVVAGEQITITGKDFLPGSTVELIVYSTPVKLGTAVVLADGTFSATVTLPKDLPNGVHHLVATGVDVNGAVRNMIVEVTVSGGTATVSSGLAYTGATPLPFVGAGVLAMALGGGLLVASRRQA